MASNPTTYTAPNTMAPAPSRQTAVQRNALLGALAPTDPNASISAPTGSAAAPPPDQTPFGPTDKGQLPAESGVTGPDAPTITANPATGAPPPPTGSSPPPNYNFGDRTDNNVSSYIQQQISAGLSPQEAADQANQLFNLQTGGQAVYYPDTNTIGLHTQYLAGVNGNWNVVQRSPEGPSSSAAPSMGALPIAADASQGLPPQQTFAGPAAPAAASGVPSQTDLDSATRQKLLELMNPTATDGATLAATPEAAAERYQSQRSAEAGQAQAAEQAARDGTYGSGGAEAINRGIVQQQGAQDTQFLGQLSLQKKQQDIQSLQFALTQAQQSGEFDKAQALAAQLAQMQDSTNRDIASMNNATNRYGISTNAGVTMRGQDFSQQANQDNLGFNYTQLQQSANQNALMALLGGVSG